MWGDRNTRYFHSTTVIRRKRKRIEALRDSNNNRVHEPESLKQMAIEFYGRLYTEENANGPVLGIRGAFFPRLSMEEQHLGGSIVEEEVRKAVFDMGAYKASGPDGLQPVFIKANGKW